MIDNFLRNGLSIILGVVIGSIFNLGILELGFYIFPLPSHITDFRDIEIQYFLFPFLAHSVGTLLGSYFTARLSVSNHFIFANIIGVFFFFGGIMMFYSFISSPTWFVITDLIFAYIPMSILGWKISKKSYQ